MWMDLEPYPGPVTDNMVTVWAPWLEVDPTLGGRVYTPIATIPSGSEPEFGEQVYRIGVPVGVVVSVEYRFGIFAPMIQWLTFEEYNERYVRPF
jgi:hypothetical protein